MGLLCVVEEDWLDDSCFVEEFDCSVDGCFGDSEAFLLEGFEELVCLEDVVEEDDGVEDLGAFWGVFEVLGAEC